MTACDNLNSVSKCKVLLIVISLSLSLSFTMPFTHDNIHSHIAHKPVHLNYSSYIKPSVCINSTNPIIFSTQTNGAEHKKIQNRLTWNVVNPNHHTQSKKWKCVKIHVYVYNIDSICTSGNLHIHIYLIENIYSDWVKQIKPPPNKIIVDKRCKKR